MEIKVRKDANNNARQTMAHADKKKKAKNNPKNSINKLKGEVNDYFRERRTT